MTVKSLMGAGLICAVCALPALAQAAYDIGNHANFEEVRIFQHGSVYYRGHVKIASGVAPWDFNSLSYTQPGPDADLMKKQIAQLEKAQANVAAKQPDTRSNRLPGCFAGNDTFDTTQPPRAPAATARCYSRSFGGESISILGKYV